VAGLLGWVRTEPVRGCNRLIERGMTMRAGLLMLAVAVLFIIF